jgi:hypothetical protein
MTEVSVASAPGAGAWRAAARARSVALIEALAVRTGPEAASFHCVAAAGSLGRLEAGEGADLDTLFIVDEARQTGRTASAQHAIERFFAEVAELGLREPKPNGIFRSPVSRQVLLDPARTRSSIYSGRSSSGMNLGPGFRLSPRGATSKAISCAMPMPIGTGSA